MGGSFQLTWEEGREGKVGGSFHLTPSPFTSAKAAAYASPPVVAGPPVAAVKEPVPSLIHSSVVPAHPLALVDASETKRSSAWEEYREGGKGGRELSAHLGGRKGRGKGGRELSAHLGGRKGGKGGRVLSSHPIAVDVAKGGDG